MRHFTRVLATVAAIAVGGFANAAETVTVFAAASMTNALEDVAQVYRTRTGNQVRFSFAATSVLARQIEQGAPAQVFFSADEMWMNYLAERNLIEAGTRVSPVGNRLVLIAPADSNLGKLAIEPSLDLVALLGPNGRLSTGDPAHVPVGTYAKEALEKLGLWSRVAPRVAPAENVRVALALVERGEAPLGIVYATDAALSKSVKVVGEFPAGTHAPVTYPFAIVKGRATPDVQAFFAFATGEEGRKIFEKFGFVRD